jgi:hypothetical protein
LTITKLAHVFEIFADEEEALRSFAEPAARSSLAYERRVSTAERGVLRRRAADRRG